MAKNLYLFVGSLILFTAVRSHAGSKQNCYADLANEAHVYSSDFKWNMSLDEIKAKADELYKTDKRLAKRAYYDEQAKSYVFPNEISRGGNIRISEKFVRAIQKHVEKAFERKYINALIFPDMGHSHFLIPNDFYDKEIAPIPVSQFNQLYEKIFNFSEIKVVYHTAEQLKMLDQDHKLIDNKEVQWRYFTRNLVGHNNSDPDLEIVNATTGSAANTLSEVSGYRWWGGGFNIHASQNGCFEFKKDGKSLFFDLSLQDLEPAPGSADPFTATK